MELNKIVHNLSDRKIDWRLIVWLVAAFAIEFFLWIVLFDVRMFLDLVYQYQTAIWETLHIYLLMLAISLISQTLHILVVAGFGKLALALLKRDLSWPKLINLSMLGYLSSEVLKIICILPLIILNNANPKLFEVAPLGSVLFILNSPLFELVAIAIFVWLVHGMTIGRKK